MNYTLIPVTPYQQNCSLIWCQESKKAAFIDPGGEAKVLLQAAQNEGVTVEKILLTHGHLDHVGAAQEIATRLAIPIIGPQQADEFWFDLLPQQAQMFNFAPLAAFKPDHWLAEGEQVQVGEIKLSVRHCPGHTPGHVIFFSEADQLAFVGDVLFNGSVGRSDFPQGDHDTLIRSIKEKLLPLGDEVTFIPGHGPTSTFGHERRHNTFLNQ